MLSPLGAIQSRPMILERATYSIAREAVSALLGHLKLPALETDTSGRFGGCKKCNDEPSFRSRRMLRPLWAAALALTLLGLPIDAITAQAATITSSPAAHVYLLRGAFNIFSLGMDHIAARLGQMGIATTVTNYLAWQGLADQAAAEYKSGRIGTIILVGHSSGATAVTEMATRLSQLGVPVKLAIGLDPTSHETATGNVDRYVNYYVAHGLGTTVARGSQFSGTLENVDVENNRDIGHFNIDKNRALQERVIGDIRASLSSPGLHCVGSRDACSARAKNGNPEPSIRVTKRTSSKTVGN
jgi:hypothetical protein